MDAVNTPDGFMTTNEWKDEGEGHEGCLTSLVRPLAVTLALGAVMVLAYTYAPDAIVSMWWS